MYTTLFNLRNSHHAYKSEKLFSSFDGSKIILMYMYIDACLTTSSGYDDTRMSGAPVSTGSKQEESHVGGKVEGEQDNDSNVVDPELLPP